MTNRRLLIALGAALLVGGWGTTRYIHEFRMAFFTVNAQMFYGVCVLGMTLGAGLIGFGVFPKKE